MIKKHLIDSVKCGSFVDRYYFTNTDTGYSFGDYNIANDFVDGVAIVGRGDDIGGYLFGAIDKMGNEVIPLMYHSLYQDTDRRIFICQYYNDPVVRAYNGDFLVHSNGKLVVVPSQNYILIRDFSEGLAAVCENDSIDAWNLFNNRWGYINVDGELVIPCRYLECKSFSDGLAFVETIDDLGTHEHVIDIKGNEVFEPNGKFFYGSFHEGRCKYYSNGKCGFINKKGEIVIPAQYESVADFHNGIALVKRQKQMKSLPISYDGYLLWESPKGCIKLPLIYKWFEAKKDDPLDSHFIIVYTEEGKVGVLDFNQREVIPCKYDAMSFSNSLGYDVEAKLKSDSSTIENGDIVRYSLYTRDQPKRHFPPGYNNIENRFDYDVCLPFVEGIALVRKDNLWGLIKTDGALLIDQWFQDVVRHKDYFDVKYHNLWGSISCSGKTLVEPIYETIDNMTRAIETKEQFYRGDIIIPYKDKERGLYGLIDKLGNYLVPPKYKWVAKINDNPSDIRYICFNNLSPRFLFMVSNKGDEIICAGVFGEDQYKLTTNGQYDWAFIRSYYNGTMLIKCNGKFGFALSPLDADGNLYYSDDENYRDDEKDSSSWLNNYIYDSIEYNDDNTFTVSLNGSNQVIDITEL